MDKKNESPWTVQVWIVMIHDSRYMMYDESMPQYPHTHRKWEWWVLGLIMLVAFVFRFQYIQDISNTLFGFFTVLGTYLLAKRLFNWQIAAMASFLLAVSSWHALYAQIAYHVMAGPFFLVFGLYFFWRGKTSLKLLDFAISGALIGLGMRTGSAFRIMPLVLIIVLLAYWHSIKRDYGHRKYEHTRNQLIRGFATLMVVAMIAAFPVFWNFLIRGPGAFTTLSIANFTMPHILWPVGLLFVIGLTRSCFKLVRRWSMHGHYPTVPIVLLSWLLLGLASGGGQSIIVAPVVTIFAGEGLWWLYDFSQKWYGQYDAHEVVIHEHHGYEKNVVATLAVCLLLVAIMLTEYHAYFSLYP